ncbi:hypothetical protein [Rhodococcus sp. 008]|uniref:hypothetical protein n=1 Tax=Rhodococcus sp. 008 TaxID=1723645 RepID=UPI0008063EFA|nr:hypothetical protein [Rhodococcus sp. 008]ANQ74407.1 hypothetical protein AOT96_29010 [Rhodococcus sp. 008]
MREKKSPAGQGEAFDKTAEDTASDLNSTPGPRSGYVRLSDDHIDELIASAIPPEVTAAAGVYTAQTGDELPEWAQWLPLRHGDSVFPALVYPMTEPDGSETGQVKPAPGSVVDADGNEMKYVSPAGAASPQLPVVREVDDPRGVLIVEGVKQALASNAWAPEDWAIYRICGITGWSRNGIPTKHLRVVRGLDVVIVPDADSATKRQVYDGAVTLGEACEGRRAKSVAFVRVAGFGSTGVDDALGNCADDDERREQFEDWLSTAADKPAKAAPRKATAASRKAADAEHRSIRLAKAREGDARPVIHVGEDRKIVIDKLDAVLRVRFDGTQLFRHGDALGQLVVEDRGPVVSPVSSGAFPDLVSQAAITVEGAARDDESGCSHAHAWPDRNTLSAIESRYRSYNPLDGVSAVPVVRPDGSIVTASGYDAATRHYVHLADDLTGLTVPDSPTDDEIAAARTLLVDDLLGDFAFKAQSDLAHAVAALVTPVLRPLLPTSPGLAVNGLQAGIGKGLLLDVVSTIVAGSKPELAMLPGTEDEVRKTLTAYLHSGQTAVFFDETAELQSAVLSGCITAESWSDRRLGVTERISMPNKVVFFFAGNQMVIAGDMARRVVQIRLHTDAPNPQNRMDFRHSDLKAWVAENRSDLLRALLILCRAWFVRGQPVPEHAFRMGTFERWQDMVGGILMVAGVGGFLDGMAEQRLAADFDGQCWVDHLGWLAETFGVRKAFTAKEAADSICIGSDADTPPGLESLADRADPRALGKAWAKQADRWRENLRIVKVGTGQGGRVKWLIEQYTATTTGGTAPTPPTPPAAPALARRMPAEPGRPMPVITDLDASDEVA